MPLSSPSVVTIGPLPIGQADVTGLVTALAAKAAKPVGGDLSGNLPNPTVAKVNGVAVTGTPSVGDVPTATGAAAATWQAPSGAPGGILRTADYLFTERATAGTYTATLAMPAGAWVFAVQAIQIATWAADNVDFGVGEGAHPNCYIDIAGGGSGFGSAPPYARTNPVAGGVLIASGGAGDNSIPDIQMLPNNSGDFGVPYLADDTITLTAVSTIGSPPVVPTGSTLLKIGYFTPITAVIPSFA